MMRKYFPLEASERLFVAIEDDVVDAQVSLPPTIALSCSPKSFMIITRYACNSGSMALIVRSYCV